MIKAHQQFWNNWAEAYQGFSELIEPYRDAERDFALLTIDALENSVKRRKLRLLDVGGGAGNMIVPMLDALLAKRGNLEGVSYTLTDSAERMLSIALARMDEYKKIYPQVVFKALLGNTMDTNFAETLNIDPADVVISSWNIEYYSPQKREEMVIHLTDLANVQGIIAFSSMVRLPTDLTIRDVLMPLGRAQVVHALLTGGPGKMKKVIESLKEMTKFSVAVRANYFPDKPNLAELDELVKRAGLHSAVTGYHLYGTSAVVIVSEDGAKLPPLPRLPIAQALAGRDGYDDYPETLTFRGYLKMLLDKRASTK